jgi:hypothetical protein
MDQKKFVAELAKLRPPATFLFLHSYRNEFCEVSDFSIVFHMSYENALRRSLEVLEEVIPKSNLEADAKRDLVYSYRDSLKKIASTPIEKISDEYTRFFDAKGNYIKGVKLHTATNTLHLYGLVVSKHVRYPGWYPLDNRRELTVLKDKLRRLCPVDKFRQFRILPNQVERISVENITLLPPK